jgi:putative cell wall-binding protein
LADLNPKQVIVLGGDSAVPGSFLTYLANNFPKG